MKKFYLYLKICLTGIFISFIYSVAFSAHANICHENLTIKQRPIDFGKLRTSLTQTYQKEHYGINTRDIHIDPKFIVLHWTETRTFETAFKFFYPETLGTERPELSGRLNVSAHYLVDRDGTAYQLMPDNWVARHVVGLNHYAIGIENVGGIDKQELTPAQIITNAKLVCHLKKKYPSLIYLIGHKDYLQFKNSPYWLEKDERYIPHKPDPGNNFVSQVHLLTRHLGLQTKFHHNPS